MHHIGANRLNNNNNLYYNAVNLAIYIKNQLQNPNQLPLYCNLVLNNEHVNQLQTTVMIEFTLPGSNHKGHVMVGLPAQMTQNYAVPILNGYVHMLCAIDALNGYFMKITVNNFNEMLSIIEFCQNLLEHQPLQQEIDYVRLPPHMLNYWFVPNYLRALNMNENNNNNLDQNIVD
jgi:hypothetical protein